MLSFDTSTGTEFFEAKSKMVDLAFCTHLLAYLQWLNCLGRTTFLLVRLGVLEERSLVKVSVLSLLSQAIFCFLTLEILGNNGKLGASSSLLQSVTKPLVDGEGRSLSQSL